MHHLLTSTYTPNLTETKKLFVDVGRTYVRMYIRTFENGFIRSTLLKSQPKNKRISNLQGLVTLTLDRVILHTVVHHLSTSTFMPNFTEIELTFCGRTQCLILAYHCLNNFIKYILGTGVVGIFENYNNRLKYEQHVIVN